MAREAKIHYYTDQRASAPKKSLLMPKIKDPQEGARDLTRAAESFSLDISFKVFKEGFENLEQRFEEQDIRQKTGLEIFKNELREDLDGRLGIIPSGDQVRQ